jgi:hypothetical protein
MGLPLISRSAVARPSPETNRNDRANDTLLFRANQFPARGIFGAFFAAAFTSIILAMAAKTHKLLSLTAFFLTRGSMNRSCYARMPQA